MTCIWLGLVELWVCGENKRKKPIRQSDTRRSHQGNGKAKSGCVCKTVGFSLRCSDRGPSRVAAGLSAAQNMCRTISAHTPIGSPPRNCSSDPRLISAGAPHESTTPTSNLARSSARTGSLSRTCQNAVWCCDPDSPISRRTRILCDTGYRSPSALTATANSQTIKVGSS